MRLSIRGKAIAGGLLWGGGILCVGLTHLARPTYGVNFLDMISSVYPWLHGSRGFRYLAISTIDGLIDGAVAGILFGWLYNLCIPDHGASAG